MFFLENLEKLEYLENLEHLEYLVPTRIKMPPASVPGASCSR